MEREVEIIAPTLGFKPWNKGLSGYHVHTEQYKQNLSIQKRGNNMFGGKSNSWNRGKHGVYSEETLFKMSLAKKGKIFTEEERRKRSEELKRAYAFGERVCSEHCKQAISRALKGKKQSEGHLRKLSVIRKGKHHSINTEFKRGEPGYWLGRQRSVDTCRKLSEFRRTQVGELAAAWQGGLSFEPYGVEFNKLLKEQVRQRDNYKCQICHNLQIELGYKLPVHHIDYNKKNNDPFNLISLCRRCHSKTNVDRDNWIDYFNDLKMRCDIWES